MGKASYLQLQPNSRTKGSSPPAQAAARALQRNCACGQLTVAGGEHGFCRHKRLTPQRAAVKATPTSEVSRAVHEALRSPAQPLDTGTRAYMAPRFALDSSQVPAEGIVQPTASTPLMMGAPGDREEQEADRVATRVMQGNPQSAGGETASHTRYDFSQVRVHTGPPAVESARAINALAYTVGQHIVFGAGQYQPHTNAGRRLVAHELAHVVQQSGDTELRVQAFTAELGDANKVYIKPEKGDSDADLDRVLCATIKDRKIRGRKKIDVTDCLPKGVVKAMEAGPYNCADFVRRALGEKPSKDDPDLEKLLTPKLWEELLKKGFRIRSFGVVKKKGKVEPAEGLSWKQPSPRMGDLVFMKGEITLKKGAKEPDPAGDTFTATWDHVGFFIVRSRDGLDFHLAKDGDENPIGVYHTGSEPAEGLLPGAYVKGVESLLAYVGRPDPETKKKTEPKGGETLRRTALRAGSIESVPPIVHDVLRSPGQPLEPAARAFMEPRFGHDFGGVRVHTDARAAESARAVNARAYTVGTNVAFAEGQYRPATEVGRRLLAHELTHVVQQHYAPDVVPGASLTVGVPGEWVEREADRVADALDSRGAAPPSTAPLYYRPASTSTLQRQPAPGGVPKKTTVRVRSDGGTSSKDLPQGKGGSEAVVYQYEAIARHAPTDEKDQTKGGAQYRITLPLLVYPPASIKPPKADLFVFFHGHRADLQERAATGEGAKAQGTEPIALWTHLKEAVAGTDRIGIAPQAPKTWTWRNDKKKWRQAWDWQEALAKTGVDGLIKIALDGLTHDLGLDATPLVADTIHVAGHSRGGVGIGEATDIKKSAKLFGDKVQDVTLQDAGYGFGVAWDHLMDWFLHGSPGKTMRVLISQSEGNTPQDPGDTRSVLNRFNVEKINEVIKGQKQSDIFKAEKVTVPDPKDQKPRPGGFVLESQLVVKKLKTGDAQGTMVVFFAPGGGHYETATASMGAAAAAGPKITETFLGEAKPGQYRVISGKTTVYEDSDLSKPAKEPPAGSKAKNLVLPRDTIVEVTELKWGTHTERETKRTIISYKAHIKGKGWTPLSNLAPPTPPMKVQPKWIVAAAGPDEERDARTQQVAAGGLSGAGARLPYLERIQRAFGSRHDLSSVRAHLDEHAAAASRSIGAAAYTVGESVAFDGWPDLHTAVHEAAHVVQQRRGVSLPGGVGQARDPHEQHADAVADAAVAGRSAAPLLDGPGVVPGIAGAAMQRKDAPLPKGAISSSELDPMDTSAETAFMAKVYDAQQQWAIKNRTFTAGLPETELEEIEDKIKMHKSGAPDAKALLDQARADLAAQQAAGDLHALKVKKIGIDNAYRGIASEKSAWQQSFRKHYGLTKDDRAALDGGEFGDATVQLLASRMRGIKAIPGFSNHSKGLAVDVMTIEKGLGSLGPDSGQRESWRKSWFWTWLNDHAATYNFSPLSTEEWHWDHS